MLVLTEPRKGGLAFLGADTIRQARNFVWVPEDTARRAVKPKDRLETRPPMTLNLADKLHASHPIGDLLPLIAAAPIAAGLIWLAIGTVRVFLRRAASVPANAAPVARLAFVHSRIIRIVALWHGRLDCAVAVAGRAGAVLFVSGHHNLSPRLAWTTRGRTPQLYGKASRHSKRVTCPLSRQTR